MQTKKRQKLCYNCEGEVDLEVIFCPYCGADLLEEKEGLQGTSTLQEDSHNSLSLEETTTSLYPPPYQPEKIKEGKLEKEEVTEEDSKSLKAFFPIFLLTTGIWCFLLGVLLFIFSENGFVILKLDAKLWLTYLLLSAPLLFMGSKLLSKMK